MWYVFIGQMRKPIKTDKKLIKNVRQEKILQFVKDNGSINNSEARDLLGLADSTVKRILKAMVDERLLSIEGERKARKYLLKE